MKIHFSTREVIATYEMDDLKLELSIALPVNYPLGPVTVTPGQNVRGSTNWSNCHMQLSLFLTHQVIYFMMNYSSFAYIIWIGNKQVLLDVFFRMDPSGKDSCSGKRIWTKGSMASKSVTSASASCILTPTSYQNCPVELARKNSTQPAW